MRKIYFIMLFLTIPLLAQAQRYNDSPIVITGESAIQKPDAATAATIAPSAGETSPPVASTATIPQTPPLPPNFPDWAVSQAGQNTAGNTNPGAPASPQRPASPTHATAPEAAPEAAKPTAPPSPDSPINKLWPRDTVPIFVKSCVGFHIELIPACTCVITELMATMPHDEFLELSQNNKIESDARLIHARQNCVATPARKE